MTALLLSILEACLAVMGVAVLAWSAFAAATVLCERARASLRWTAAAILAYVGLSLVFWLLISLGAFNRIAVLGLLAVPGLLLQRRYGHAARQRLHTDLQTLRQRLRPEERSERVALAVAGGATAVVLVARTLRGLATPPMATDALTYHLLRAGRWVQSGEWVAEAAPDAAGYYEHYPALGDALWAFAMLPFHADTMVALAGALALLTAILGTYAAARSLGAAPTPALLGAFALACTPSVMVFVTTAYVDIPALAAFTLGLAWLTAAARVSSVSDLRLPAALCISIFAVGVGIKVPLLVPLGLAGLFLLIAALTKTGTARQRAALVGILCLALLPALPGWLRETLVTGNPLYPFPVRVGGVELLAGNVENELNMSAAMAPAAARQFELGSFLRALFWPRWSPDVQHLNFGPAGPALLVAGIAGLRWAWKRGHKVVTVFVVLVVAAIIVSLLSDHMLAHRTFAAPAVGRLLTMGLAAAIVSATLLPLRLTTWLLSASALVGAWLSWPRGLGPADAAAILELLGAFAPTALLLTVLAFVARRRVGPWPFMLIGLLALLVTADRIRPRHRYEVWAAAVPATSFDPHPIDPVPSGAWTIWRSLDAREGLRIAYVAGWDGRGHHWYRYPLLGSDLQHQVFYVPPTQSGTIIDYREADVLQQRADPRAWLQRLHDQRIDILVLGGPPSIEGLWVTRLPDIFELLQTGEKGRNAAFEIHPDALETRLSE